MKSRTFGNVLVLVLWLLAAGVSYLFLLKYKGQAGAVGHPPAVWPPDSLVQRDRQRPTLVMLAHPRCPCTVASLDGLARLLGQFPKRVAAHVLFLQPRSFGSDLEHEDLWQRASALPEVTVSADPMGREAQRFGVTTSGHVLVYDPEGQLLFDGGITPARGHGGASLGLDRLFSLLAGAETAHAALPVFGCPLQGPGLAFDKEKE